MIGGAIGRLLAAWATCCATHRTAVLAGVGLLTVLAGVYAALASSIDSDLSKLIRPDGDLPWYQHDQDFKAAFPQLQQTGLVVLDGPDFPSVRDATRTVRDALRADGSFDEVLAPGVDPFLESRALHLLDDETFDLWRQGLDYGYGALLRLSESPTVVEAAWTMADHLAANPRTPLPPPLASIADRAPDGPAALADFDAWPHLEPDAERHYGIVLVRGAQRLDARQPNAELVAAQRRVLAAIELPPAVRARLSGEVKLADEEIGAALSGIGLAGTVSIGLLAIILGFGLRSPRAIASVFALLASGVVLTLAFATLTVGSYNTLALIFVVMFFGLGVDFAVHFLLRVGEAPRATAGALADAAREVGPALCLCALTTSIAFLSFAPTAYRGLAELGIISAGGMVIAMLLTITLLPALLVGSPQPRVAGAPTDADRRLPRPAVTLAVTAALALAAAPTALQTRFDYNVLAMRDAGTEGMTTLLELQRAGIATDYSINVLVPPEQADAVADQLRELPTVETVAGISDLLPRSDAARGDALADLRRLHAELRVTSDALPWPREAVTGAVEALRSVASAAADEDAERLARFAGFLARSDDAARATLDEAMATRLRTELAELDRQLAAQPWTAAMLPPTIRSLMVAEDGRSLLRVQPVETLDSRAATTRFIESVADVAPNYSGRTVVEWGVGAVVVEAFAEATALAVGAIAALLLVWFRSVVPALLVLAPIALSLLLAAALAQLLGIELNMANILVLPLVFGLGVDTGIHVVHRFRERGDLGELTRTSTPRAVLISGTTTIGTFASLTLSPHQGAASIGALLFLAIGLLLLCTFVVLPALLSLGGSRPTVAAQTD